MQSYIVHVLSTRPQAGGRDEPVTLRRDDREDGPALRLSAQHRHLWGKETIPVREARGLRLHFLSAKLPDLANVMPLSFHILSETIGKFTDL